MLVCRVALGTTCKMLKPTDKENPLRRPPERANGVPYDSVMGEAQKFDPSASVMFREFIVYDRYDSTKQFTSFLTFSELFCLAIHFRRQCYPEYIVRFKRV
jgi:hypothetical protein